MLAFPRLARAEESDADPWGALGFQLGMQTGPLAGYGVALGIASLRSPSDALDDPANVLIATGSVMLMTVATTSAGTLGLGSAADRRGWSEASGWAANGAYLGGLSGAVLATGGLFLFDEAPSRGQGIATALAGAAVGGVGGYSAFRYMAETRGSAGWEVLGFWGGTMSGVALGMITIQMLGDDEEHRYVPAFTAALGGVLGTYLAHRLAGSSRVEPELTLRASARPAQIGLSLRW